MKEAEGEGARRACAALAKQGEGDVAFSPRVKRRLSMIYYVII